MAKDGKIIGVVSGKGGVGKTMVSVNLGAALSLIMKKKTVIVDCNIGTSHLGISMGMHYCPHSINDVLKGAATLSDALVRHEPTGMMVLPASLKATNVKLIDAKHIGKIAHSLSQAYDYVILDGGPGMGREAFATLLAAEELLYVSTPTLPAVIDVVRYKESLSSQTEKKHLGVVLNMFDAKPHQMTPAEVEKLTLLHVLATIPTDIEVQKSLAAELPIAVYNRHSPAAKAIADLSAMVAGSYSPPKQKPTFREFLSAQVRKLDALVGF